MGSVEHFDLRRCPEEVCLGLSKTFDWAVFSSFGHVCLDTLTDHIELYMGFGCGSVIETRGSDLGRCQEK
jgi:hypothetical protein